MDPLKSSSILFACSVMFKQQQKNGHGSFFPVFNEPSFIKCILMIVHQHHYAIVHEHSYWVVHQQQKNPLHQQNRWWSGFFCRCWTGFLWPSLNKIVGQEPLFLVREQLYGIVPELAFISRWWIYPNSLADILVICVTCVNNNKLETRLH